MGENKTIVERIDNYLNKYNERIIKFRQDNPYYENNSDEVIINQLDRQDVKNHKLPQTLKETWLVLEEDKTASKYVHQILKDFLQNEENKALLKDSLFGNLEEAQVYLSTEIPLNACIIMESKPTMIIVSKGAFLDAKGRRQPIDLLASVLGHELAHKIVDNHVTKEKTTQTEEHACDTLGVLIANRAGYCPLPVKKYWKNNNSDDDSILQRVLESHPSSGLRAGVLSTIIGALELKGHTISKANPKRYDSKDLRHIKNLKVNTVLTNILQACGYNKASPQEKKEAFIHITRYLLLQRPSIFKNEFHLYERLFKSFKKEIQEEITQKILSLSLPTKATNDETYNAMLFELFGKTQTVQAERKRRLKLKENLRQVPIETIIDYSKKILTYQDKYCQEENSLGNLMLKRHKDIYRFTVGYPHPSVENHTIITWQNSSGYFEKEIKSDYVKAIQAISQKEKFDLPWKHILDYIDNPENPSEKKELLLKLKKLFNLECAIRIVEQHFVHEGAKQITDLAIKQRFLNPVINLEQLIEFEKIYLSDHLQENEKDIKEVSLTYPYDFKNKSLSDIVSENKEELTPLFTYDQQECLHQTKNHPQAKLFLKQLSFLDEQNPGRDPSYVQEFYHTELPALIVNFFEREQVLKARRKFFDATKTGFPKLVFSEKSPYIQFLKTPEGKKLSLSTKISILSHSDLLKENHFDFSKGLTGLFNFDFFEVLDIKEPKTFDELYQLNDAFENAKGSFPNNEDMTYREDIALFHQFIFQTKNYINRSFLHTLDLDDYKDQYIDLSKMGFWLSAHNEKESYEVNQTMAKIAEHNFKYLLSDQTKKSIPDEISFICAEYQRYNNNNVLSLPYIEAAQKNEVLRQQFNLREFSYHRVTEYLHYYPLADDHYHLNELLEDKITQKISNQLKVATPKQKQDIYKVCYAVLKETPPQNPDFRKFLIKTVASLHAERLGLEKDAISQESFLNSLNPDQYLKDFPTNIADDILCQIMARCETQKEVTFKIRDKIQTINNQKTDAYVQSIREGLLYSHSTRSNLDILDFLKQPLTPQSTYKAAYLLEEKAKKWSVGSIKNPLLQSLIKRNSVNAHNVVPMSTKQTALANFHRQFWKLPPEAQALIMQYLLFHPDETKENNQKNAKEYFKQIKKEINETADFSNYQNLALDTYFDNCETEEAQALFIAALYTMNPPAKITYTGKITKVPPRRKQRPGEVIKKILSQMGAAGGKTLQAIHSYPGTNEEIRADLKDSKSNFNPPKRYEIFESIEKAETFDDGKLKGQTAYVGRLLGSGSFGFTLEIKEGAESETGHALTLLHPNALETANNQFKKFFLPIAKKLASKNRKLFGALPSIITQARHLTAIEADFLIGGAQTKVAEEQYKGIRVQTDGYDFQIKAAPIADFGRRFKKTEMANGEHFNDLPTTTKEEKAYKKAVAKAIFTTELYTLLQMGPIDSDRHGAQVRVDGTNITLFDHGAIDFEITAKGKDENGHTILEKATPYVPSVSERRNLGRLIGEAFSRNQKGEDFTGALIDVLSKDSQKTTLKDIASDVITLFSSDKEKRPKLSATMQRALLALGDYIEAMGETPDERNKAVQECLACTMQQSEQLDDVLLVSIARNLPSQMLQQLSAPKTEATGGMQLVDAHPYPKNQTPAFEQWILNKFKTKGKKAPKTPEEMKQAVSLIKQIEEQEFAAQSEEKQAVKNKMLSLADMKNQSNR